ncbi:arginine N-methyltransferase, putative [Trichomonas vaginalis G3]|uniref:type I protein arginine methyltransferase n=1 Tax=Trichomonas vaginalis (strain ATCC PRA-98 / G3) TaxID=412133 RepID=A2DME7_TRIV3|nr:arginine omega-N asymmetric methyltransferase protein [Trichomonas vaginalis G3]EAY18374.1 arginine N-methyltransferase, putative [Trichomonas vaginalis G3]KAI5524161.1 arginine omega-N asymmetric methyltransferase protein [Trichomonas vaginalis G3]|eukprot:XP_001579360.1 arginine N-methyltransferase [Trichomonas vaginalis G3]
MSEKNRSNYSFSEIHDEMINDEIRTLTYNKAILDNKNEFKDKIVVDVGAGTGILSLFAAQAGAKKVYAIECTEIANIAEKIIKDNNFENIITIVRGRANEITLPEKVDIIISEWMGYSLYYEVMLPAVLNIRDRYLKPDGKILPSHANLYLNIVENPEFRYTKLNSWESIYDLNFTSFKDFIISRPYIDYVDKSMVASQDSLISSINIRDCTEKDIFFESSFKFVLSRNVLMDGFTTWFDALFLDCKNQIKLSTSPYTKETHWKSTIFYLNDPIELQTGDIIEGLIKFRPHEKEESALNVDITFMVNNKTYYSQSFEFL